MPLPAVKLPEGPAALFVGSEAFGLDAETCLHLRDASRTSQSLLRHSLAPSLALVQQTNEASGQPHSKLFEIATAGSVLGHEADLLEWLAGAWGVDRGGAEPASGS